MAHAHYRHRLLQKTFQMWKKNLRVLQTQQVISWILLGLPSLAEPSWVNALVPPAQPMVLRTSCLHCVFLRLAGLVHLWFEADDVEWKRDEGQKPVSQGQRRGRAGGQSSGRARRVLLGFLPQRPESGRTEEERDQAPLSAGLSRLDPECWKSCGPPKAP